MSSLTKNRPKAKHLQRVTLITGGLGLDSTIAFPYPKTVGLKRRIGPGQRAYAVWLDRRRTPARFLSYWERNVVKDAAFDGGLTRVDKKMSCGGYASWSLYWGKHFRGKTADVQWRRLHKHQRMNHFPGTWSIGRKDRLARTIQKQKRRHASAYSFLPECWILPSDKGSFKRELAGATHKNLWIARPDSAEHIFRLIAAQHISQLYGIGAHSFVALLSCSCCYDRSSRARAVAGAASASSTASRRTASSRTSRASCSAT